MTPGKSPACNTSPSWILLEPRELLLRSCATRWTPPASPVRQGATLRRAAACLRVPVRAAMEGMEKTGWRGEPLRSGAATSILTWYAAMSAFPGHGPPRGIFLSPQASNDLKRGRGSGKVRNRGIDDLYGGGGEEGEETQEWEDCRKFALISKRITLNSKR